MLRGGWRKGGEGGVWGGDEREELTHLASQKYLQNAFCMAYLAYLLYWTRPEYTKFLMYPGPTLRVLELLQVKRSRSEVLSADVAGGLAEGWRGGSVWK